MITRINKRGAALVAAALALSIPLAGCGKEEEKTASGAIISNDTLASLLANDSDLSTVSEAMNDTGLAQVFDGTASYTILAPTDEAFAADAGESLDGPENRALLADVLRDHVLPGSLNTQDIAKAIESSGGPVEMTTMGDMTVTFSKDGDRITAKTDDGTTAVLGTKAVLASNGSAIPIDAILRKP